jgi:hypothetical protein
MRERVGGAQDGGFAQPIVGQMVMGSWVVGSVFGCRRQGGLRCRRLGRLGQQVDVRFRGQGEGRERDYGI